MMKYHAIAKMQKYAKYAKLFKNEEHDFPAAQLNPKCRASHRYTFLLPQIVFQAELKNKYVVEYKTSPGGVYQTIGSSVNEVPLDTPLKLSRCKGSDKEFLFSEKDNNEITCSDAHYDFDTDAFKGIIDCYGKEKIKSDLLIFPNF